MVAWDKICQLKSHGGLGLRKTDAVNLVFQAKLAWKVLWGFEGLWTSVMKHKYLNSNSFLECKLKSIDSPVWKSILRSRVLLRKGLDGMWIKGIAFCFGGIIGVTIPT